MAADDNTHRLWQHQPVRMGENKEWTNEELKILHDCINRFGVSDNCVFSATRSIERRSMLEIRDKLSEIGELTRLRRQVRIAARKNTWLKAVTPPSQTSEVREAKKSGFSIQCWSDALSTIQKSKQRNTDYSDASLLEYLGHEIKCRPTSTETRKLFRVTDSTYCRGAGKAELIDCSHYYRYLQSCLSGSSKFDNIKPLIPKWYNCIYLGAAVFLNILDEIQKEVDDPKHEFRRRILAGMFRDIQDGDLSMYDFRNTTADSDDVLSQQLNPLYLPREMLEIQKEQS
ncbi:unnamed protein product [Gongylonema pulchrum]|uniref:SANT domain-containing protein n=1 Tax=Gongylonema pulchrum TaxID=637853 RepID=A0A183CXY9_9BILA|nr:unnamed protein product [Gongylonema pulchrum]